MSIMVNISGVTLTEFFLCIYYRVYTLKHCEIILLHSYINYYTKSQIGVLVTNTTCIEFRDQLVITQDNQNAP